MKRFSIAKKLTASFLYLAIGFTIAQTVLLVNSAKADAADGTCDKATDSICGLNGQNYQGYELRESGFPPL